MILFLLRGWLIFDGKHEYIDYIAIYYSYGPLPVISTYNPIYGFMACMIPLLTSDKHN